MSLGGKVAVVTGASSGIGAAIANALAAAGASVVGLARRYEPELPAPCPGTVVTARLDLRDSAAIAARMAELPAIDVLVHSAGVGYFGPVAELSAEQLREMMEVHVVGPAACIRAALPQLRRRKGQVLFIGSIATRVSLPDCAGYAAAKYAQLGYARALATEERERGVRVTTAVVGATDTALWHARPGFDREMMSKAEHVAEVIVGLVDDRAINVDEIVITPPGGIL